MAGGDARSACGMQGGEVTHRVRLLRTPEGRKALERPWRRWEDDITADIKVIGGDSSGLGHELMAGCCERGRETCFKSGKLLDQPGTGAHPEYFLGGGGW
jgi:hypothetical protein